MSKRSRGKPRRVEIDPEVPEPAAPEELARACMQGPPKRNWRYRGEKRGGELRDPPAKPAE